MTTPPKPSRPRSPGSLPPLVSVALFVVLLALVSWLSLNFLLALVDKLT